MKNRKQPSFDLTVEILDCFGKWPLRPQMDKMPGGRIEPAERLDEVLVVIGAVGIDGKGVFVLPAIRKARLN